MTMNGFFSLTHIEIVIGCCAVAKLPFCSVEWAEHIKFVYILCGQMDILHENYY